MLAFAAVMVTVPAWAGQREILSQPQDILDALFSISTLNLSTAIATAIVGSAFSMRAASSMATTVRLSRQR